MTSVADNPGRCSDSPPTTRARREVSSASATNLGRKPCSPLHWHQASERRRIQAHTPSQFLRFHRSCETCERDFGSGRWRFDSSRPRRISLSRFRAFAAKPQGLDAVEKRHERPRDWARARSKRHMGNRRRIARRYPVMTSGKNRGAGDALAHFLSRADIARSRPIGVLSVAQLPHMPLGCRSVCPATNSRHRCAAARCDRLHLSLRGSCSGFDRW